MLTDGMSAVDAVTEAVVRLEDIGFFHAGKGSSPNSKGEVELDASIMDGSNLDAGAIAGVHNVRNPILLARRVMTDSVHVMLSGSGAEAFAREQGLELRVVPPVGKAPVELRCRRLLGRYEAILDMLRAHMHKVDHVLPILITALLGCLALVLTRVLRLDEAYKAGQKISRSDAHLFQELKKLIQGLQEVEDPVEFLDSVRGELYDPDVYALTPAGEVRDMPRGSTPIDFAYAIHTAVGDRYTGARVNGRLMQLKNEVQNRDIVEIITSKKQHPKQAWLQLVKTSRAKHHIRRWIRTTQFKESVRLGREMIERELRKDRSDIRVLILTALSDEEDLIEGFQAGADDYMPKPYSPRELLARIRAVTRRARGQAGPRSRAVSCGPLRLDLVLLRWRCGLRSGLRRRFLARRGRRQPAQKSAHVLERAHRRLVVRRMAEVVVKLQLRALDRRGEALGVEHRKAQIEATQHLDQPLVDQRIGQDDQHTLHALCQDKAVQDQPGLDGLTQSHFIRQQHPRGVAPGDLVRDVKLMIDQTGAAAGQALQGRLCQHTEDLLAACPQLEPFVVVDLAVEQALQRLVQLDEIVQLTFAETHLLAMLIRACIGHQASLL